MISGGHAREAKLCPHLFHGCLDTKGLFLWRTESTSRYGQETPQPEHNPHCGTTSMTAPSRDNIVRRFNQTITIARPTKNQVS